MKVLTSFLRQNENNVWIVLINWRRINVVATHNWWKRRAPSSTAGPNFFSILCQWIAPIDCRCNGECENKFIMPGYKTRFSGSSICSHILMAGPLLAHGSIVQECTTQVLSHHPQVVWARWLYLVWAATILLSGNYGSPLPTVIPVVPPLPGGSNWWKQCLLLCWLCNGRHTSFDQ